MFLQSVFGWKKCFVPFRYNKLNTLAMNIPEKIDSFVQYIIQFIEKIKGYVDMIIDFFTDLRDKIEGLLEYIDEKLQSISSVVEELKHHEEAAA